MKYTLILVIGYYCPLQSKFPSKIIQWALCLSLLELISLDLHVGSSAIVPVHH